LQLTNLAIQTSALMNAKPVKMSTSGYLFKNKIIVAIKETK